MYEFKQYLIQVIKKSNLRHQFFWFSRSIPRGLRTHDKLTLLRLVPLPTTLIWNYVVLTKEAPLSEVHLR